jgi:D-alanine-D-alanine ligase
MKIGITFDLKTAAVPAAHLPDDAFEEFDSPQTIEAISTVLRGLGHTVTWLGDGREFLEKVLADPPDFVFNFAEGQGVSRSREARVPAVLEMLGIPYTGSDPFTLAIALDKDCTKKLVALAGVDVAPGFTLEANAPVSSIPIDTLRFPLVVKPAWEGSSKGIRAKCLVQQPGELAEIVASLRESYAQTLLLEEYIAGDEVTVGLFGNADPQILGMMNVVPKVANDRFMYSLEVKRDYHNHVTFRKPEHLSAETIERMAESARTAFRVLGCRDVARADFRVRDGVPYFLEVNPLPGLHPVDSDLVLIAYMADWSYEQLVTTIVNEAIKRVGDSKEPRTK